MYDVIIIGGGQSALACAYFLHRTDLKFIILDDQPKGGGAWLHVWDSLTLFSPPEYSSLPGWMMPKSQNKFPSKDEVIAYLTAYQERYHIEIERPVKVLSVINTDTGFRLSTSAGTYESKTLISATGTWQKPFIPEITGRADFKGIQIHAADYKNASDFIGKKVLIVGSGNSGAQILAEVSAVTKTVWAVQNEPQFLPDDVDGRVLFDMASAQYHALKEGKEYIASEYNLGNIVMVPPVVEARGRKALVFRKTFQAITSSGVQWTNNETEDFDAIIWCTGFKYATDHLRDLQILDKDYKTSTTQTRSNLIPGLYLVGYGNWTGFASATLIGVGRSARETINEIKKHFKVE